MNRYIIIPKRSSVVEQNAAHELKDYLEQATGKSFSVETEHDNEVPGLYVGFTDFALRRGIAVQDGCNELNGAEAWMIKAVDGCLVLTGGREPTHRGILYAVYHYLEDVIGVRWWNAMEEYVPRINDFAIDTTLEMSGEPKAVMRFPVACSFIGDDPRFCVRRRANQLRIAKEWGGGVNCSPRGQCHTLFGILPREGLFEQNPDWFAWSEARQKHLPYGQYCLNNPELLDAFEKAFIDDITRIRADCDAAEEPYPHHFHISMDDTPYDCECPVCREVIARSGSTGNVLRFVNRMARAAARIWPDVLVETLVYWTYMELPKDGTVPEKNVIIRLANLDIDILHDLHYKTNTHALEVLEGWSAICKKGGNPLCVWDYNINYSSTIVPNTFRLGSLFRTYEAYGVSGYFIEHEEPLTSDFWCLKNWLLSHLMENPQADEYKLADEFLEGYYGPAAEPIRKYLQLAHACNENAGLNMKCVENFTKADMVTWELVIEGYQLFDEAAAAVEYDPVYSRRVRQARCTLDYTIVARYDSLMYMARRRDTEFPIDRQTPALRYALCIQEGKTLVETCREAHPDVKASYDGAARHYQNQLLPYRETPLPLQFADCDPGQALQVPLHDIQVHAYKRYSFEYVLDDTSDLGRAARINLSLTPEDIRDKLVVTTTGTEVPPTLTFTLRHRGAVKERPIHKEELEVDGYKIYRLFTIEDLDLESNTMLRLPLLSIHLSGFSGFFLAERISLWLSMKATGSFYGGQQPVDALWLDRLFLIAEK